MHHEVAATPGDAAAGRLAPRRRRRHRHGEQHLRRRPCRPRSKRAPSMPMATRWMRRCGESCGAKYELAHHRSPDPYRRTVTRLVIDSARLLTPGEPRRRARACRQRTRAIVPAQERQPHTAAPPKLPFKTLAVIGALRLTTPDVRESVHAPRRRPARRRDLRPPEASETAVSSDTRNCLDHGGLPDATHPRSSASDSPPCRARRRG